MMEVNSVEIKDDSVARTHSIGTPTPRSNRSALWLIGGILLALIAIIVLIVGIVRAVHPDTPAPHEHHGHTHSAPVAPEGSALVAIVDAAALPDGEPFTERGTGVFHTLPVNAAPDAPLSPDAPTPNSVADALNSVALGAITIPYTIDIEGGINTTHYGGNNVFAWWVHSALGDPRGWTSGGRRSFHQFDTRGLKAVYQEPSGVGATFRASTLHFTLATPATTRTLCGYNLKAETSCWHQPTKRVIINLARFVRGARTFPGDLSGYRYYVINHELGHGLGFGHEVCGANNSPAPVMMQQTLTLSNADVAKLEPTLVTVNGFNSTFHCRPNPWPNPENVTASTLPELPVTESR